MDDVETCGREPLKSYPVNALGVRNLALEAHEMGAMLIRVSTDYVFDRSKRESYSEGGPALPLNLYGNTRLVGGAFIRSTTAKHFTCGHLPCMGKAHVALREVSTSLNSR